MKHTSKGFTIIELMMSTAVFSVILMVITVGVISFTRSYYRGLTSTNTQATARAILTDLAQGIQFSSAYPTTLTPNAVDGTQGFCIGGKTYSYRLGIQIVAQSPVTANHQDYHGLVEENTTACQSPLALSGMQTLPTNNDARELLGLNMRLARITLLPNGTVGVRVVYGDDDLLNPARDTCNGNVGSQFCAVSDLNTTVIKRL